MTFFEILSALLIGPLKLLFEIIYVIAYKRIGNPGLSIIALSLIMNFLVLPLYKRADAMQEQARDTENKLHKGVAHIKKAFSGDEQMMVLQTYYRQNDYRPTDALHGSVSLLLEIPFFIAAYQFLSHLELLSGVAFGPIADLSAPDGLLTVGGMSVNLLPIIMTLVNIISSLIFLKGHPLKTKIQLYAMALFFLVFLYSSPSGLVFYWTLNNVFSLCKTVFYKLKNPGKAAAILSSAVGIGAVAFALIYIARGHIKFGVAVIAAGLLMQLPALSRLYLKKKTTALAAVTAPNKRLFIMSAVFLTILVGVLIPSTYIAASPQEYIDISYFVNPLWYVVNTLCLACGTFIVWLGVFYWLASDKGKVAFERVMCILCVAMLADYMFFGTELGVISAKLKYEYGLYIAMRDQLINLAVLLAVAAAVYFAAAKWHKAVGLVLVAAIIALGGMSAVNVYKVIAPIKQAELRAEEYKAAWPSFTLSKSGKNVVVLMTDRAMGEFLPYIFNEKPELVEKFDGMTYYSNVISHGSCTNFGTPGLFGGYEYTPVEMNRRDTETLAEKHNEALKVMPVLFMENGYDVTVCDPPYANYQWIPDLSIYDEYPEIRSYITSGRFGNEEHSQLVIDAMKRNLFCFSLMKTLPLCMQNIVYDDGKYNQSTIKTTEYTYQMVFDTSTAVGKDVDFVDAYNVLMNLSTMTVITDEPTDTFLELSNMTPHLQALLQQPDYTLSEFVDNSEYEAQHADRFTLDGQTLHMDNTLQMTHYHANMATMLLLGEWFDYLRENGVYDNTRIIIVADHGYGLGCLDELQMTGDESCDVAAYFPLLLVKDFDSHGFTTSDEFMTNADVPTLATANIIENPINPFTGKPINSDEKHAHDQFIIMSENWDVSSNDGNTFRPGGWASVHDNIWQRDNWVFSWDKTVLKDYVLP